MFISDTSVELRPTATPMRTLAIISTQTQTTSPSNTAAMENISTIIKDYLLLKLSSNGPAKIAPKIAPAGNRANYLMVASPDIIPSKSDYFEGSISKTVFTVSNETFM